MMIGQFSDWIFDKSIKSVKDATYLFHFLSDSKKTFTKYTREFKVMTSAYYNRIIWCHNVPTYVSWGLTQANL